MLCARRPYGSESMAPWLYDGLAWRTLPSTVGKGATCWFLTLAQLQIDQVPSFTASESPHYIPLLLSDKRAWDHGQPNIFWPVLEKNFTLLQIAGVVLGRQRPNSFLACYKSARDAENSA